MKPQQTTVRQVRQDRTTMRQARREPLKSAVKKKEKEKRKNSTPGWHRRRLRAALRVAKRPLPLAPALAGHHLGAHTLPIQLAHPPEPRRRLRPCGTGPCQYHRHTTCQAHSTRHHGPHFSPGPVPSRPWQSIRHHQCAPCDRLHAANARQSGQQTAWTPHAPGPHVKWARFAWQTAPAHRQSG